MDIATKCFLVNLIVWALNYAFLRRALDEIAEERPEAKDKKNFIRLNFISNLHAGLIFISIPAWAVYKIITW